MDNYNSMMNNEQYNEMVYGDELQNSQPMTSIPSELPPQPPSDIINLSYQHRDSVEPSADIVETSTSLFPQETPTQPQLSPHHEPQPVAVEPPQEPINQPSLPVPDEQLQPNSLENVNEENSEQVADDDANAKSDEAASDGEKGSNEAAETDDVKPDIANLARTNDEPDVDPNQCRICKATEQLIDIFAIEEDMRICDIIMKICTDVRIHERDFLPHMICLSCLGKLRATFTFVNQIRSTDKELRSKLKRSKKARKTNDFVLLDANVLSEEEESDEDDLNDDDDEFKVSELEVDDESDDDDSISEDDDVDEQPLVKRRSTTGVKKSASTTPTTATVSSKRVKQELLTTTKRLKRDIVFIEADDSNEEEERKVRKERCRDCNKTFTNKNSLQLHRKNVHTDEFPFKCTVCSKSFKYSINLVSHMQVHKESYTCDECDRVFASKSDSKKHALNQHKCSLSYECNKCRRLYCSIKRYQKHRESCSNGSNASSFSKKRPRPREDVSYGSRDLFASVAPATTTYWSDSFSD